MGMIAAAATLLVTFSFSSAPSAQAPTPAAAERGEALVGRLGCVSCHGAPGAGGTKKARDLAASALGQMQDGGAALYAFMGDMTKGHPDLNGNFRTGAPAIKQVTQAEAADILAVAQAQYAKVRAERGRVEAPAAAAAAGLGCKVTDGLYILNNTDKETKVSTDAYEVACDGALGRVVLKTVAAGQTTYAVQDCISNAVLMADGRPNTLACALPANQMSPARLAHYLDDAGVTCDLKQARAFGATADAAWFEAACAGDRGYVVGVPLAPGKDVTARNCLAFDAGASTECRLITRDAMLASATAPLIAAADSACQPKARRYVAASQGDEYYEIACASGAGFMVAANFRGAFKTKVECANAEGIAGGCTLTDVNVVLTADNARYTGLAKAAGYDCAVSGYRAVASTPQDQTVEMTCANRADGALAQFPKTGAPRIFNCAAAETTGYRCNLTKPDAAFARLTAAVRQKLPTSTCQVAAAKFLGVTPDSGYVEVACADKLPGYVVQYAKATAVATDVIYCSQLSSQRGVTCGLPTNLQK
jgi:hypothetical protein